LTDNVAALTFPAPGELGRRDTRHLDATTAGNFLLHGSLTTPKTINNGDPALAFAIGASMSRLPERIAVRVR
jgi:hypothetical protein